MTVTLSLVRESAESTCVADTNTDSLRAASDSLNVRSSDESCATSIVCAFARRPGATTLTS